MKTKQSQMGLTAGLIAGLLLFASLPENAKAAEAPNDLAAQINHAAVMYQPLMWVGSTPPTDAENKALDAVIENMKKSGAQAGIPALEEFVQANAASPWRPSLLANLGRYYYEHGLYTKALDAWELAWAATKDASDGSAKKVADFTFAYWTKLLASLGRMDTLKSLYEETDGRTFDAGSLQQIVNQGKEGYHMMCTDPGVCFKCGTFALNNIARYVNTDKFNSSLSEKILQIPSPSTGFSMTELVDLAVQYQLDLVPAQWGVDKTLVVPSVVHWKENHYVAILQEKGHYILTVDPTFGKQRWLKVEDVQAEASGYFMVPKDKLPTGWKTLAKAQTDLVFGRGYVSGISDGDDSCGNGSGGGGGGGGGGPARFAAADAGDSGSDGGGVSLCGKCGGGGGGGGGGTGGGGGSCPDCPSGMAVWEVSEPYINLWLYDEPLGYQPAIGARISCKLAYKQRETRTTSDYLSHFPSFGMMWNGSWISYIIDDGAGYTATMVMAGGGERTYTPDNLTKEYYSHTILQRTTTLSGVLTGFIVSYASGAKDYYNFIPSENLDAQQVAFLTAKVDKYGHSIKFMYHDNVGSSIASLDNVVDTDGRVTTLAYANGSYPAQITSVQDPFGKTATFTYDPSGMLTNITDVLGLNSGFIYNNLGWITNLTTPYGRTKFEHYVCSESPSDEFDDSANPYVFIRTARVIDAVAGTNVYMLRQDSSYITTNYSDYVEFLPFKYGDGVAISEELPPIQTFFNSEFSGIYNGYLYYRNSFHWGPKQAMMLPSDIGTYGIADFLKARMRHWAHGGGYPNPVSSDYIGQSLDLEQAPSPDGIRPGQTTWFGYQNKYNYSEGSSPNPILIARVLPDGTTWYDWITRDDWDRPTNVISTYSLSYGSPPLSRTNIYVYDASGINLVQQISPLLETNSYGYDAKNNLLFFTNAVNEVTAYTYDSQGRRTSMVMPSGLVTTNIYPVTGDYTNYVQTVIDLGISRTNSYTYTNDLIYSHVDERGLTTTNNWDHLNRLVKVTYPDGTFATNSYYRLDLVRMLDRLGFTNSYGYDGVRRKIAETNADGAVTLYNYCSCGALESIQDAAGNYTTFDYDNAGRMLSVTYPDTYTIYKQYDLMGRVTNTIDSGGISTSYWYNNQGLRYAVTNGVGRVSFLIFDLDDRVVQNVDANGVTITNTYDPLGRLRTRGYSDGGVEDYGYTLNISGPTSHTNQIGNIVRYAYDSMYRKTNEMYVGVTTNSFTYDAAGDLLTLTDGNGDTTTWNYDEFRRVTNKVDAVSNILFKYQYDQDNRLTNRWTAAKTNTFYSYDAVGNLTKVDYHSSPDITLKYDALNRLTNMVDAVGTTVYGYDATGQLLSENGPWSDDTVSYTYANRLRAGMSIAAPNASAWVQGYGYDSARRLTGINSSAGEFGYAYDPVELQRVDVLTLPNGAYITNTFDNVARLTLTELANSHGTNLDSYAYTYNQASQRTLVSRTMGDTVAYTYDNMGELKTSSGKEVDGVTLRLQEQLGYAYDDAGNLNFRTNNAVLETFNVNSLNELSTVHFTGRLTVAGTTTSPATNVTVNAVDANLYNDQTFAKPGQTWMEGNNTFTAIAKDVYGRTDTNAITVNLHETNSFAYDLNGNLLTNDTEVLVYDDENELVTNFVAGSWKSEFVYDGKMRRRIQRDYAWNGSSWAQTNETRFIYDGNVIIQHRDANNLPTLTLTRGTDLSGSLQGAGGIGGILAMTESYAINPTHSYFHSDGNGNVTMLINAYQIQVAKAEYDPFGGFLSLSGPKAGVNPYWFSSKLIHWQSGKYDYLYRWYVPNLQRWLNRDPAGERGGVNLFNYIRNNSINNIDPLGLSCVVAIFPFHNFTGESSLDDYGIVDYIIVTGDDGECPACEIPAGTTFAMPPIYFFPRARTDVWLKDHTGTDINKIYKSPPSHRWTPPPMV